MTPARRPYRARLARSPRCASRADGALARADAQLRRARGADRHGAGRGRRPSRPRSALVVEAGTGVGKTFAYLVPALLSRRARAGQHRHQEPAGPAVPARPAAPARGAAAAGDAWRCSRGARSYLCLHRWSRRASRRDVARPLGGARAGQDRAVGAGHRAPATWPNSTGWTSARRVIPLVTSTRENCLGSRVPASSAPAMSMQARREAMAADVVVVNHHLFFADLALRDTGVAELLPSVEVAVFDEAHQLTEAGVQFLGTTLGTAQVHRLRARPAGRRACSRRAAWQPWQELAGRAASAPRASCAWPPPGRCARCAARSSCAGTSAPAQRRFRRARCRRSAAPATRPREALEAVGELAPDFAKLRRARRRARRAGRSLSRARPPAGRVRWIDLSPHQARLVESPLDIRDALREQMAPAPQGLGLHLGHAGRRRAR